jgi:hypothetical protein
LPNFWQQNWRFSQKPMLMIDSLKKTCSLSKNRQYFCGGNILKIITALTLSEKSAQFCPQIDQNRASLNKDFCPT